MSLITFCLYVNTIPLAAADYNRTIRIILRVVIADMCSRIELLNIPLPLLMYAELYFIS